MRCAEPGKTFVLLIGHGSRLPHNKEMADMHARLLKNKGYRVYTAFNEMTDPSIEETMYAMVGDGAEEIVVLPLFIAPGRHTDADIPIKLGIPEGYGSRVSSRYGRDVIVHYKEPFGDDPGVTDILLRRLKETDCSGSTGVLVFAHGSPLRYNSELVNRTSGRLRDSGVRNVFVGFNEYNEPSIEDSYAEMIGAGFDRIIMLPMFLASGAHISEEIPGKLGIPEGGRGGTVTKGGRNITVLYTEPLGLCPEINDILVRKIESSILS
ncbi:MAG: hypothetical protein LBB30_04700 [Candidatus Methanoplasma sp.]|jgi:sirohydrochlorin cobaltochelatase|nr:hypothetical protein [Candidatus Methanoplasma sp.]